MRRAVFATLLLGVLTQASPAPSPAEAISSGLTFRNIGPFRTSAWVTEIAVPETPPRDHLYTIYAATRSGGLWKTSNNGVTWAAISDSVGAAAVGAVALSPSNPDHVWMGTGANDVRREVWRRDKGQCAFVGPRGRCEARAFIEYHHVVPYARGGAASVDNIELRCRAHNSHEAQLAGLARQARAPA